MASIERPYLLQFAHHDDDESPLSDARYLPVSNIVDKPDKLRARNAELHWNVAPLFPELGDLVNCPPKSSLVVYGENAVKAYAKLETDAKVSVFDRSTGRVFNAMPFKLLRECQRLVVDLNPFLMNVESWQRRPEHRRLIVVTFDYGIYSLEAEFEVVFVNDRIRPRRPKPRQNLVQLAQQKSEHRKQ